MVRVTVAILGVALAAVLAAGTVMAQGNSRNAALCLMGGWQNLVTEEGNTFESAGECISYAAKGGTPSPPVPSLHDQWQSACEGGGGYFYEVEGQWQCLLGTYDALEALCTEAGGLPANGISVDGYLLITCSFS